MNTERIQKIAQAVQDAFLDVRDKINTHKTSEELRSVIKLLPVDKFSQSRGIDASRRLSNFPKACCADGAYVLAALLHGLNASCGLGIESFEIVHAENPQNPNNDHYWVRCDGISYDVTYGQFDDRYRNRVLIGEHPLDIWNLEVKPIRDVPLAEYINSNYIRWSDDDNDVVVVRL